MPMGFAKARRRGRPRDSGFGMQGKNRKKVAESLKNG